MQFEEFITMEILTKAFRDLFVMNCSLFECLHFSLDILVSSCLFCSVSLLIKAMYRAEKYLEGKTFLLVLFKYIWYLLADLSF